LGKRGEFLEEKIIQGDEIKRKLRKINNIFFQKLEFLLDILKKNSKADVTKKIILKIVRNYLKRNNLGNRDLEVCEKLIGKMLK
jgi:poly(3-hydroxyalkanoate) synthetase